MGVESGSGRDVPAVPLAPGGAAAPGSGVRSRMRSVRRIVPPRPAAYPSDPGALVVEKAQIGLGIPEGVEFHVLSFEGPDAYARIGGLRSEEHTSELQSLRHLVCRLLLEKKKQN